ncbi:hypothetical protein C8Q73DRAFT_403081 [Cubamyces lactineus]|nr:hypothetical protein C8Q73DRAFT_403081 [Cubamyces lactineus]
MVGGWGMSAQGRWWEGRREGDGARARGKGRGRQVARLESEGVKRSPSHFCCSASPAEVLHAQPPDTLSSLRPFPTQPSPPSSSSQPAPSPSSLSRPAPSTSLVPYPVLVPASHPIVLSAQGGLPDPRQIALRLPIALSSISQASALRVTTRLGLLVPAEVAVHQPPSSTLWPCLPVRARPDAVGFSAAHPYPLRLLSYSAMAHPATRCLEKTRKKQSSGCERSYCPRCKSHGGGLFSLSGPLGVSRMPGPSCLPVFCRDKNYCSH